MCIRDSRQSIAHGLQRFPVRVQLGMPGSAAEARPETDEFAVFIRQDIGLQGLSLIHILDIVETAARAHALETTRDDAANLVVTLPGSDPALPVLACGSHLDSVPRGGNYDGAAGVIAGLMALVQIREANIVPRRTIRLYGLRGEESAAFGRAYIGSSALFGRLTGDDLAQKHAVTGRPLHDCMRDAGAAVERISAGEVLLDPASVFAWLELHIEQGPVLIARKLPVAVVTGIRGNVRHRTVTCIGEAGHSGAVPRWLRHDAVFAVAELLTRLDGHWQVLLGQGHDLVVTAGVLGTCLLYTSRCV